MSVTEEQLRQVRASLNVHLGDRTAELVDGLDLGTFLDADGRVDGTRVADWAAAAGARPLRRRDFGGGRGEAPPPPGVVDTARGRWGRSRGDVDHNPSGFDHDTRTASRPERQRPKARPRWGRR